jgi:NADPH-dependent 2,4-dienoyl-CoA reductase/sulfur reductase-like enzyme
MPRKLAAEVRRELDANQARLHLGCEIKGIDKTADHLHIVCNDRILAADMVLVAIGIEPNSQLAADAGIETGVGSAIAVNHKLQTSNEAVYAAGDCADAYHVVTGQKTWIPLALRANRAGWAVADNVCGKATSLEGVAGTAVFKVFNLEVARTGLSLEESNRYGFEPVDVTIQTRSRAHAHPGAATIWVNLIGDKKSGRLLGAQMVGREGVAHRINAVAVALHGQMSVKAFSETDLSYAPPFGPVWDPLLTAANQLFKKM